MSQSDYIQRKKIGINLKTENQNKFENIINSNNYTLFKQYTLENTILNTSKLYNQLVEDGKKRIFNMELNSSYCPQFIVCENTQNRTYRKLTNPSPFNPYFTKLPYVTGPTNTTLNQLKYVKEKKNNKCPPCYYDSSYNRIHMNNQNTNFTTCSNNRLNQLNCYLIKK